MLNISEESKIFLKNNLPEALELGVNDALRLLYRLIDTKGFAPPKYEDYNDFGREAQKVYDDIYLNG